jgi:cellulose synthase operon protein C
MRGSRNLELVLSALALLASTLAGGCRRQPPAPAWETTTIDVGGCDAVAADARCEATPGQLLRVSPVDADARVVSAYVLARGGVCSPTPGDAGGEPFAEVVVAELPAELCASVVSGGVTRVARAPIVPSRRPQWFVRAQELRRGGRVDEARALADAHTHGEPLERARADGLLARLALARGDTEQTTTRLARSAAALASLGRWSEEADDRFALAFTLATYRGEHERAAEVLRAPALEAYADGRAKLRYYRAVVAHHAGYTRRALRLAREATLELRRRGLSRDGDDAEELGALSAMRLGRAEEARDALRALAEREAAPCTRVTRWTALATATLMAAESHGKDDTASADAAARHAETALSWTETRCPGGLRRATSQLALARARLAGKDLDAAQTAIDSADRALADPPRWVVYGSREVTARVALQRGDAARAARSATRALELAVTPAERWSAGVTLARAETARGRRSAAVAAYAQAERELDALALEVPLGEGRAIAASRRAASAHELARLLAESGDPKGGSAVVRRSRARILESSMALSRMDLLEPPDRDAVERLLAEHRRARATLDELAATLWEVPLSEREPRLRAKKQAEQAAIDAFDRALARAGARGMKLPAHRSGDLDVVLAKDGDEFRAFVTSDVGTRVLDVGAPADPAAWTKALVAPLSRELERSARVRLIMPGDAQNLDLHALSWSAATAPDHARPVVYGVDVERDEQPIQTGPTLIVSDPRGDLPGAREESSRVAAHHAGALVLHQADATRARVLEALAHAPLFHYAGHATLEGTDGISAGLSLAHESSLTVTDILSLPHGPRRVVLSACDAGRGAAYSVSGPSLAQAFVVAGASDVFAPLRIVSDEAALAMGSALYQAQLDLQKARAAAVLHGVSPRDAMAFAHLTP